MNTQWFSVKDVLPPIDFEVVFAYPNAAYGGHLSPILGRRVDENEMISSKDNIVFRIGNGDTLHSPFVTHWAYNTMPDPSIICDCSFCYNNRK